MKLGFNVVFEGLKKVVNDVVSGVLGWGYLVVGCVLGFVVFRRFEFFFWERCSLCVVKIVICLSIGG